MKNGNAALRTVLSYVHGAHDAEVVALAHRLITEGVPCELDVFELRPRGGWSRWMTEQMSGAEIVLVICSEAYYRRFHVEENPGVGQGVTFESGMLNRRVLEAQGSEHGVIPVMFDATDVKWIPEFLRDETRFIIPRDYDSLYRMLTQQPAYVKPPLGRVKLMPPLSSGDAKDIGSGDPIGSSSVVNETKLSSMEGELHKRIIGQNHAISAVTRAIRRSQAQLNYRSRPIGSFFFLGPTGVGKTEVARALAEFMFGDAESLVRIDMSEYVDKHALSRLVGAPLGHDGYQQRGQLTEAVRRRRNCVVLLDGIEKAHPDICDVLEQVLEFGRLGDGHGEIVDFTGAVLVMTSSIGTSALIDLANDSSNASKSNDDVWEKMKYSVLQEVRHAFRPAFLNRLDEVVLFHQLDREQIAEIVGLELHRVIRRISAQDIYLEVTEGAKQFLAKRGWDPLFGAPPVHRAIQREVLDALAEEMLKGTFASGDRILAEVSLENAESLCFSKIPNIDLVWPTPPEFPA